MVDNENGTLTANLRKIITLGDQLRDCGISQVIALPRIVVIGTQSSGKSSLLESIVGLDFLPRGSGVVTRTPLELRMINVPRIPNEPEQKPFAIFDDTKEKLEDLGQIKEHIIKRTNSIAGNKKDIKDKPIIMSIYSHDIPNLSLVDLPGITRLAIDGQADDIEKVTKDMTSRYIQDERTIILCVIAANQDLSTSDGLQLAKLHDPEGFRTCAVLTKVDIMDPGTNALQILKNNQIKLKHGYIAVKLRGQQDIDDDIPVKKSKITEKEFFATHPVYRACTEVCGTDTLSKKLSHLLYSHIKECLPKIQKEITDEISKYETRRVNLGEALPTEIHGKHLFLTKKVLNLRDLLVAYLEGKEEVKLKNRRKSSKKYSEYVGETYLRVRAYEYTIDLEKILDDQVGKLDNNEIRHEILKSQGRSLPGFYSFEAFEKQVRGKIDAFSPISERFAADIYNHLKDLLKMAIDKIFTTVPDILNEFNYQAEEFLEECFKDLNNHIGYLNESEKCYVFTSKDEFLMIPTEGEAREAQAQAQSQTQSQFSGLLPQHHGLLGGGMPILGGRLPTNATMNQSTLLGGGRGLGSGLGSGSFSDNKQLDSLFQRIVSEAEVDNFKSKLALYLTLYIKNLSDTIPKYIMYSLIQKLKKNLGEHLISKVLTNEGVLKSMEEDPYIVRERQDTIEKLKNLKKARDVFLRELGQAAEDLDESSP